MSPSFAVPYRMLNDMTVSGSRAGVCAALCRDGQRAGQRRQDGRNRPTDLHVTHRKCGPTFVGMVVIIGRDPGIARVASDSAACLRRGQGAALGSGEVTLESEVFTGVSAGARVDAGRAAQELRLTDHARPHGSDLAFDLSIIASLDGSRSQPPVPAAENPAMRDAAALLETERTFKVLPRPHRDDRLRRAGRDRSADLRVTRWAKDESEAGAAPPSVVGQTQFLGRGRASTRAPADTPAEASAFERHLAGGRSIPPVPGANVLHAAGELALAAGRQTSPEADRIHRARLC